jgi:hypothetical protein
VRRPKVQGSGMMLPYEPGGYGSGPQLVEEKRQKSHLELCNEICEILGLDPHEIIEIVVAKDKITYTTILSREI